MRTPSELTGAFRERGLKITPQRQLLFRLLHDNDTHPTADALYTRASAEMPGISRRTVYQTLNDLTAMGELRSLQLSSGAVRFDPNVDEHDHVVCVDCGTIRDVYLAGTRSLTDELAPQLGASELDGFQVQEVDVMFSGRCARCAAAT